MKHKTRFSHFLIIAIVSVFLFSTHSWASGSQEQSSAVRDLLHKNLGETEYKDYFFRDVPISGFGVGTVYQIKTDKLKDSHVDESYQDGLKTEVGTWLNSDVVQTDAEKQSINSTIIREAKSGKHEIATEDKDAVSLKAVVPNIEQIVSLSSEADYSKGVQVSLSATDIVVRKLNLNGLQDAIDNYDLQVSAIGSLLDNKNMVCTGDVELVGYTVAVNVDKTINASLDAQLTSASQKPNPSLNLSIQKSGTGTYSVSSTEAVIAAVLFQKTSTLHLKAPTGSRSIVRLLKVDTVPLPWKVPDGVKEFTVDLVGAGGGGGHTFPNAAAGGGGAGGYVLKHFILKDTDPKSYPFKVGKASYGATDETKMTWFGDKAFLHADGGKDSPSITANNNIYPGYGGAGGAAGGSALADGDIAKPGDTGETIDNSNGSVKPGGKGASTIFGEGGQGGRNQFEGQDADQEHYGSGGGGGAGAEDQNSAAQYKTSSGAPGVIRISYELNYKQSQ